MAERLNHVLQSLASLQTPTHTHEAQAMRAGMEIAGPQGRQKEDNSAPQTSCATAAVCRLGSSGTVLDSQPDESLVRRRNLCEAYKASGAAGGF